MLTYESVSLVVINKLEKKLSNPKVGFRFREAEVDQKHTCHFDFKLMRHICCDDYCRACDG